MTFFSIFFSFRETVQDNTHILIFQPQGPHQNTYCFDCIPYSRMIMLHTVMTESAAPRMRQDMTRGTTPTAVSQQETDAVTCLSITAPEIPTGISGVLEMF